MHVLSFTTLTRGAERCHSSIFGTSNKADGTSMLRTSAVGIILTYIYHVDIEPSTVECLNTPDLNRSTDSKINMLSVIHMLLRFSWYVKKKVPVTIWTTTDCIFPLQIDVDCPFSPFDHCDRPKFLEVVRDLVVFATPCTTSWRSVEIQVQHI